MTLCAMARAPAILDLDLDS